MLLPGLLGESDFLMKRMKKGGYIHTCHPPMTAIIESPLSYVQVTPSDRVIAFIEINGCEAVSDVLVLHRINREARAGVSLPQVLETDVTRSYRFLRIQSQAEGDLRLYSFQGLSERFFRGSCIFRKNRFYLMEILVMVDRRSEEDGRKGCALDE